MEPTIASQQPITSIMRTKLLTARPDTPATKVLELLRDKHVGCIPIIDLAGRPLGIVTKLDILETLGEARRTAREIMMPFARTLDLSATIGEAAVLMSNERVHHVLVVDDERTLIGLVSSLDIAEWVGKHSA